MPPVTSVIIVAVVFLVLSLLSYKHYFPSPEHEHPAPTPAPEADVLHSSDVFLWNYGQMEKEFKIFVYPDGDSIYFHAPGKLVPKYASESFFFKNIRESRFLTKDPDKAHLLFIPISFQKMQHKGLSQQRMKVMMKKYVQSLISSYLHWNRTLGADHFFVACHDDALTTTKRFPHLETNSTRVVCSADYHGLYYPHKDVALPHIHQPFLHPDGGYDIQNRTKLGIWIGTPDSEVSATMISAWKNDTEIDIRIIPRNSTAAKSSHLACYEAKYCICPRGSQVNSACIAGSINYGCVPVILSDYYDLPFNDVLDWRQFSLIIKEADVHNLKTILKGIPDAHFKHLRMNILKVQKHFQWNSPPIRYDAFHMVMYELWLRRHVIKY